MNAQIPEIFEFLFSPNRYKVAHGGRGSGKSWAFARALILLATKEPKRILCTREVQNSIRDSVHRLLADQIKSMGLDKCWTITDRSISCSNGSEFFFEGLFRNVDKIKSYEGIDICWVEEAHNVSEDSWELLTPTVRKEQSEIWVSFNPKYENDNTYQRFVANQPANAMIKQVNFNKNPWFPEVLRGEMERDKARDIVLYQQKWLGKPVGTGGKIFPAFDRKLHVKEFDRELIAKKANCFMAMDPHSHYYPFCTWIAIIPKNDRQNWPEDFHKHIYAEWPTFEQLGGYYHELRKKLFYKGNLAGIAKEIYARDGTEWGIKIFKRFIDSRYAKGSGSWNWSTSTLGIVELFAQEENGGLSFETPFEKQIDAQRQVIHSDMLYNKHAPVNQLNEPSFSVDPACKNTIICLQNHRLEEDSEREDDKYKDPCDALRINYSGLVDFQYKDPNKKGLEFNFRGRPANWMAT